MKKTISKVLCIMLALVLAFSLTGCGEEQKAEALVKDMFSVLKSSNYEEFGNYLDLGDLDDALGLGDKETEFLNAIFSKLDYKILSTEKESSTKVIVNAEITTADMKPVATKLMAKIMEYAMSFITSGNQPSEEEITAKTVDIFKECVSSEDVELITKEFPIVVEKNQDGVWKIKEDQTLINILLGGLSEAMTDAASSFSFDK